MKTLETEILDLALTQALERYLEMESLGEAKEAVMKEWPEQIAVLLTEFLEKSAGNDTTEMYEIVFVRRASGYSTYIDLD